MYKPHRSTMRSKNSLQCRCSERYPAQNKLGSMPKTTEQPATRGVMEKNGVATANSGTRDKVSRPDAYREGLLAARVHVVAALQEVEIIRLDRERVHEHRT